MLFLITAQDFLRYEDLSRYCSGLPQIRRSFLLLLRTSSDMKIFLVTAEDFLRYVQFVLYLTAEDYLRWVGHHSLGRSFDKEERYDQIRVGLRANAGKVWIPLRG